MNDLTSLVGLVIKDYELRQFIGNGGFGVVYQAFQRSVRRDVAIKIIHPKYAEHPTFIQRFEAEAHLIARLEHPYIVPLHDYWRDSSGAYIAMRWLRRGSVRKLLESGPLSVEATSRMLDQIAAALHVAHRAGIVHRDLKPDNILLDENDNFYLSDFGIAKDLSVLANLTPEGIIIGSPPYLTPEQYKQDLISPRTDIYTLGIVLYELLVGEQPFAGSSQEQLLYKHLNEPLPSLINLRPDLPMALDSVIQRATAKDPEGRYEDAPALAEAFHEALIDSIPHRDSDSKVQSVTSSVPKGVVKARLYDAAGAVLEKPRRLIGRQTLNGEIHTLLDDAERVLLHGLGGVGKTSIAATVAAERIAAGKGDVIWLETGSADENALFDALARAFDQQHEIARTSVGERIEALRKLLIDKESLLVLDNVWNDRALFQMLKAVPPHMPVLITSRHIMPIDVVRHVDELDPDGALELFSYHARKDYTNDPDARALCRQLGNHPFALEIAGKRIKIQSHMTPAQFMESIADAPHNLSLPQDFADAGREGVKNLLDGSVNELNAAARTVFRVMGGMFVPTASFELLALCVQQSEKDVVAVLNDLQQGGLVQLIPQTGAIPTHYRLHDLTYSYARGMFAHEHGDRAALVGAAQQFVTQRAEDYDVLEFEQHNILGAARAAQRNDNNDALIDIIKVLAVDGDYFAARGHTETSLELLKAAIDDAKASERGEVAHHLLTKLGNAYRQVYGDFGNALKVYQEALELAPNTNRRAILLTMIGSTRFLQGADDAETYYSQAEQIARDHADNSALLVVLQHRGNYAMMQHEYETGRRISAEAARIAASFELHPYHFFSLLTRGGCEHFLDQLNQALSTHQEAYQLAQAQNNLLWMAHALRDIGEDYHALGDRNQAQRNFDEALKLWRQSGVKAEISALAKYMQERAYVISPDYR